MSKILSFRGQVADGGIDTITLHTNTGSTGYRIKKFDLMSVNPGNSSQEIVGKIYSVPQTTVSTTVDFSDPTLLAAASLSTSADSWQSFQNVVFDNMTFNQDIYVTIDDSQNVAGANYYIELEQVKLDLNEQTVATLTNIRNITQ
jgi:hypothetical protein